MGTPRLFGVYGMLGIGLMLLCLRVLIPGVEWKDGLLRFSFWALNGGLMAMCVLSLLPVGLMQTWASVEHGYWYARSGEFLHTPLMQNLRWMRVPGDTLFASGGRGTGDFRGRAQVRLIRFGDPIDGGDRESQRPMSRRQRKCRGTGCWPRWANACYDPVAWN